MEHSNYTGLGDVEIHKDYVVLPLIADITGDWAFMSSFNGAYSYCQFKANEGEAMRVPVSLQATHAYTFRIYKPDATIFNNTYYTMLTVESNVQPTNKPIAKAKGLPLQDQVITLPQAKRLAELGVKAPSLFNHFKDENVIDGEHWTIGILYNPTNDNPPAYTVAELSKFISKGTKAAEIFHAMLITKVNSGHSITVAFDIDFLYECVEYLLENNYITAESINNK